jgi:1,4-dihydroxy-2-naphthoate octaprenyltransferase
MDWISYGEARFYQGVTMMIMRIPMEELLCQVATGWIPVLECLFVRSAWVPVAMSYHVRH